MPFPSKHCREPYRYIRDLRRGTPEIVTGPRCNSRGGCPGHIQRDPSGTLLARETRQGGEGPYHYVRDGLGPVIALVNAGGEMDARYTHSPYGRVIDEQDGSLASGNRHRFAGDTYGEHNGFTKFGRNSL